MNKEMPSLPVTVVSLLSVNKDLVKWLFQLTHFLDELTLLEEAASFA